MQLHPADLLQPGLAAPVQLADAPRHAGTAHLLVHAERGAHGPLMLEGEEPTRGDLVGVARTGGRPPLGPGREELGGAKGRDQRPWGRPPLPPPPTDAPRAPSPDPPLRACAG